MTHRPDLAGLVTDNIIARARVIHAQRETAAAAGEPARALTLDDLEAVTVECSTGTRRHCPPLYASDADVHRLIAMARDLAHVDAA